MNKAAMPSIATIRRLNPCFTKRSTANGRWLILLETPPEEQGNKWSRKSVHWPTDDQTPGMKTVVMDCPNVALLGE